MRGKNTIAAIIFLGIFLCGGSGMAAQQKAAVPAASPTSASSAAKAATPAAPASPSPEPVAPAPPPTIPLADIATQATVVTNLLGTLTASAAPSRQIESISNTLPELKEKLERHFFVTTTTLEAEPTLDVLQSLQQEWQGRETETKASLAALTLQATNLQNALNQLGDLEKLWSRTRVAAQTAKAPLPILQQIDTTLTAIKAAQAKINSASATLLNLQSSVAQVVTQCSTVLAQIGQMQQQAVGGMFVPTLAPIWSADSWGPALKAFPPYVRRTASDHWSEIVKYVSEPRDGSGLGVGLFVVLVVLFVTARRKVAAADKSGAATSSAISVFERPYAAALAMTLIILTSPFVQLPTVVRHLLTIVALVPMLRVARPMLSASIASVSYTFCFLLAIDTLRQSFSGIRMVGLAILVLETLAAIIAMFAIRHHYRQIIAERSASLVLTALRLVRIPIILALFVSLFAGAAGYARLARLLTPGILVGLVLILVTFTMLRVIGGLFALALHLWPMRLFNMVAHHGEFLERRIYRLLIWGSILGWAVRYLSYLGLLDYAWSLVETVLDTKLERGTLSISLGSVLEFLLTVWLAHLLSRFLRFVLQEDVYPRVHLAPGLSYAASSLLNYVILALGVIAGLGVLGVDYSKVSILAGAFGVGIGFGLQSIVNNFVSGLILLFERPIHVGDTIEVGNLLGTVLRIGIRASVIHIRTGADIIVPNSQLITEKVTNWTLSDNMRRVDLPVGVNYGADPKKVIALLEQVARANPDVLAEPAPRALFMNYGDSSINFELRVWPCQFNLAVQLKSDLATAVFDAVQATPDISFPFPQREVRILHDPDATPAQPPIDGGQRT